MSEPTAEHRSKWKLGDVFTKLLLLLIIVLLVGLCYLNLYPPTLAEQRKVQAMVKKISVMTDVSAKEYPQFAVVTDPDALRKQGQLMESIYKDAQKDDYVFGFSNMLVIYREKENKIVYQGPSPQQLALSQQQEVLNKLTTKLKQSGIIASDSQEVPQLSIISDLAALKNADQSMYAGAQVGDITALYPQAQLFVLYRPSSDTVLKSGKVSTTFQAAGSDQTESTTKKTETKASATPEETPPPTPAP